MTFNTERRLERYAIEFKRNLQKTDIKKAGCGDRLFSCDRPARISKNKTNHNTPFVGYNSSGLFVHAQ